MDLLCFSKEYTLPHHKNPSVGVRNLVTGKRVDQLFVRNAELSLCLRGRILPVTGVRATTALPFLSPLLLRFKQDIRVNVIDAKLLLHIRKLIIEGGLHRVVEVGDNDIRLPNRVLVYKLANALSEELEAFSSLIVDQAEGCVKYSPKTGLTGGLE
ncbi:hypothetical protein LZL87_014414 [Fusarium oxysporum]|nr:hypothetical protein LZL87_014414 [Fusarium oxysporum]